MKAVGYGRVSTDKKDQANSYENQYTYFEREIKAKGKEFCGFYGDQGLTGTKLNNRQEFDRMLYDAGIDFQDIIPDRNFRSKLKQKRIWTPSSREPLFDEIWFKNTSRFARNTLSYEIILALREKGINLYFVEQNINTRDGNDFMLQLFQLFDMQDSRDKSVKVKTGINEGAKQGIIHCNSKIYGYKYLPKPENRLEIIEEEAKVVKTMFEMYASGIGLRRIANYLEDSGVRTRNGEPFAIGTIRKMLDNEKYCGLNNRQKFDSGVVFQKNSYQKKRPGYEEFLQESTKIPAIISQELFEAVKKNRENSVNHERNNGVYRGISLFHGLVFCGTCGAPYYSVKDGKYDNYKCKTKKLKGVKACNSPNIYERNLEALIDRMSKSDLMELQQTEVEVNTKFSLLNMYELMRNLDADRTPEIEQVREQIDELESKLDSLIEIAAAMKDKTRMLEKISHTELEIEGAEKKLKELTKSNIEILAEIDKFKEAIKYYQGFQIKKDPYTKEEVLELIFKINVNPDGTFQIVLNGPMMSLDPQKRKMPPLPTEEEKQQLESKYETVKTLLVNVE